MATVKAINDLRARDAIKFDVAVQIRELLDAARKQYGPSDWDDDGMQDQIIELVTEE